VRRIHISAIVAGLTMLVIVGGAGGAPARAASGNAGAVIGGFIGALLGELLARHVGVQADLRAEAELRRQRLTETDQGYLKQMATAVEEYEVDHNGNIPKTLAELTPLYLHSLLWVPGSDPPAPYIYELPASHPEWGIWDTVDDGSLDPTLYKLRALDGTLCTHATCKHIVYAESTGLVGSP
jgi:hypothetical protein